jgi:hypothetical protein
VEEKVLGVQNCPIHSDFLLAGWATARWNPSWIQNWLLSPETMNSSTLFCFVLSATPSQSAKILHGCTSNCTKWLVITVGWWSAATTRGQEDNYFE